MHCKIDLSNHEHTDVMVNKSRFAPQSQFNLNSRHCPWFIVILTASRTPSRIGTVQNQTRTPRVEESGQPAVPTTLWSWAHVGKSSAFVNITKRKSQST